MGILNVTPDSFFDGGNYTQTAQIVKQANTMLEQGATFIDIGGYSSKPGTTEVTQEEELKRVIPAIEAILTHFPETLISIDTFRSEVAQKAIEKGACMINDISAGSMDNKMFNTVKELQVPYCIMHMQGTPQTMQLNPTYENVVNDVFYYLAKKIQELNELGVNDVLIDVGFGFGKTIEQNYELLQNLDYFSSLKAPILTGISRKSMIYKTLGISPEEALNGTSVLHGIALTKGTNLLRVHDVKEAMEAITLFEKLPYNE